MGFTSADVLVSESARTWIAALHVVVVGVEDQSRLKVKMQRGFVLKFECDGVAAAFGEDLASFDDLVDLINYRLFFLFVKSQEEPWQPETLRRSVIIVLISFFETIVGFAVLYLHTHSVVQSSTGNTLASAGTAFYFSFVTIPTVGYGDYIPANGVGRALVESQLAATVLFVVFLVPALVSVFSSALKIGGPDG